VRGIDLRFYIVASHYRSHVEFSDQALDEAAAGFARIEHFLERARPHIPRDAVTEVPEAFAAAMDDDLGTPAAVGVLFDCVREGNRVLEASPEEAGRNAAAVLAMLAVLGLDPYDEPWSSGGSSDAEARLTSAIDVLVASLLEQRAAARADKDFAAADAIRDQLKEAGIEITDTPQGPRWSL
jgi:cysteinyl-tRNA synthetase